MSLLSRWAELTGADVVITPSHNGGPNSASSRMWRRSASCLWPTDTTDPLIEFDDNGRCITAGTPRSFAGRSGSPTQRVLQARPRHRRCQARGLWEGIRLDTWDQWWCQSPFLAVQAHDWGLRPLVVHIDRRLEQRTGSKNIERVIMYCRYDLHSHVVNWEDMPELQLSFLRATWSFATTSIPTRRRGRCGGSIVGSASEAPISSGWPRSFGHSWTTLPKAEVRRAITSRGSPRWRNAWVCATARTHPRPCRSRDITTPTTSSDPAPPACR